MERQVSDEPSLGPQAAPEQVNRGFTTVANLLAAVGTVWILLMMLVIVADVLGRNFFDRPITGVAEVAGRSVVAIVFLQLAAAVLHGRMTRADFLIRYLRRATPALARSLEVAFALIGALVCCAILYAAWPDTANAWRTNEYFGVRGVFTVPTLPFRAIIIGGAAVTALAYLTVAWSHLRIALRRVA